EVQRYCTPFPRTPLPHLMLNHYEPLGSPPPILVFDRGRLNRDALAADVVQDVDLIRERPAGEDFEHLERRLERRVRAPVHELFDDGALKSLHAPPVSGSPRPR